MNEERVCEMCGCIIEDDGWAEVANGEIVCQDCLDENYTKCYACGEYVRSYDGADVYHGHSRGGDRFVCDECLENDSDYYYCEHCESYHYRIFDNPIETRDSQIICTSCYEDYYRTCNECGEVYHEDEGEWGDDDQWHCNNCMSKGTAIHGYSYKPEPKPKCTISTTKVGWDITDIKDILLGVELEIDGGDSPNETARELIDISEDIYIKHDGSLSSCGMEIVSHPCTLEYHMQELGWDKICAKARENGYKSHDTRRCGLHIHVGRWQLGETVEARKQAIARIVTLVDRHWEFMKRFSRRKEEQIESWSRRPNLALDTKKYTEEALVEKALMTEERGRYMTVNLTNRKTIEFRIFNGTLKLETLMATLQLVSNICKYAMRTNMATVLTSKHTDIVSERYYSELDLYVKGRGLYELESPAHVYLKLEEDEEEIVGKTKLKVGSIVEVINAEGPGRPALNYGIGEVGRIIAIRDESHNNITVQFNRRFSYELWPYHNWNDGSTIDNCYNMEERNIRVLFA